MLQLIKRWYLRKQRETVTILGEAAFAYLSPAPVMEPGPSTWGVEREGGLSPHVL